MHPPPAMDFPFLLHWLMTINKAKVRIQKILTKAFKLKEFKTENGVASL
jgi:hypothetical protein